MIPDETPMQMQLDGKNPSSPVAACVPNHQLLHRIAPIASNRIARTNHLEAHTCLIDTNLAQSIARNRTCNRSSHAQRHEYSPHTDSATQLALRSHKLGAAFLGACAAYPSSENPDGRQRNVLGRLAPTPPKSNRTYALTRRPSRSRQE